MTSTTVAAVDFGASSIRVCRVDFPEHAPPEIEVVHRAAHHAVRGSDGRLRWQWSRLLAETERGLDIAMARGPLASIGVDTWGVDYGLLDGHGRLVEPPISYRDERSVASCAALIARIGARELYAATGLVPHAFNTIFQVAAHEREQLAQARHLVLLPELVVHHLTGAVVGERTSAGTTGLLDVSTSRWSHELCAAAGISDRLLPDLAPAGTPVGSWRGVPVHLVGGHDTASAVVGGSLPDHAFVSAGTWLIVGREQPHPDTSDEARRAGLSNEQALPHGIRLLANVAGWWLVDECRRIWGGGDVDALLADGARAQLPPRTFDATDDRFLAPADMAREIRAAAGLDETATPAEVTRAAVEAMAATTATVVDSLPPRDGSPVAGIRVFGGGSRSQLFLESLRRHTTLPVSIGPTEATAMGNALVQAVALGAYRDLDEARATLRIRQEVAR